MALRIPPEPTGSGKRKLDTQHALYFLMDPRQTLRQQILHRRQQLTALAQQIAAEKVAAFLSNYPLFKTSQHIAGYLAIKGEIDVTALIQLAWQQNKTCYLPTLSGKLLQFVRYNKDEVLKPNRFNILEPEVTPEKIILPQHLDLVLTPLVAFDMHGNRLGMGKGYYDHTFEFILKESASSKPYLIGLAYEFQKIDSLLKAVWDVPLHAVVTESNFYQCR